MKIYYYSNTQSSDFVINPILRPYIKVSDLATMIKPRSASSPLIFGTHIINNDILAATRFKTKVELEVTEDDASYRYRGLMQKPQLILKFLLPEYIDIPVGAWCEFQGQTYTLHQPMNFKKNGQRKYEYNLTMGDREDGMGDYKLRNIVYNEANKALADRRLKFSLCAKPEEFLQLIVANLNERDGAGVWKVGSYISASEKTIEFNHTYIDAALSSVASTFETEYQISDDYTISLGRVEYMKDNPLPLSYGKGNGFVPGLGRTTTSEEKPIKRLYVQGGERNIDRSTYGAAELLLPKGQTLRFDGSHFEDEEGFDSTKARTYKSDALGYYIERTDKISQAVKEDSLDCSETYPSRIGKVSQWIAVDTDKNFYDFIDLTLPTDKTAANYLNFNDAQIAGETMTVIFQDGMLAGKEFEFKYKPDERRFEIKPQEIDGIIMPNETFKAEEGNTYAVFGIALPAAYINAYDASKPTTTAKEGAEWDMFREAVKYLYEHEEQKFTFTGEIQSLWAKRHWLQLGSYLKVGAYILFTDEEFCPDGEAIRIVGIKEYLTNPHAPTLELSNGVASASSFSSTLREIENNEVVIDDTKKSIIQFTKRRFRDALETLGMIQDSKVGDFSGAIAPITVQTMAMLIGDESLQFILCKNVLNPNQERYLITYDSSSKKLHCPSGWLKHLTLGIDSIKPSHSLAEYKFWQMTEFETQYLENPSTKYYLYAKVNKENRSEKGVFVISEDAIAMEEVSGYYHFLVGILNSEILGERSFVELHGFTEILPGRITTDRIVCADGKSFIHLADNAFHIGDTNTYIDWNNLIEKALSLRNASFQIDNAQGQTMIKFSGEDGSGCLAKGNISWNELGDIIANNGTFSNVLLKGSIRTPFVDGMTDLGGSGLVSVSTLGLHKNNCVIIPGYEPPGYTYFAVPFTAEYNGFRATIINADWGNRTADGTISNNAPSGFSYYENGEELSQLLIKPYEGVEMIGIGEGNTFKGWLILNRFRYGIKNVGEGFPLHVMYAGKVEFNDGTPKMTKVRRFDQDYATSSGLAMNHPINGDKYVTIQLPKGVFSSADNYTVILSGERLRTDNGCGVYASVIKRTVDSFTVYTGDDESWNEGNFTFLVIATHLWR